MVCKTYAGPYSIFPSSLILTKMNSIESRRDFLKQSSFGGLALSSMLAGDPLSASDPAVTQGLHHPPRAKRVIQLFMAGAASHLDMFDYKPELVKRHGEKSDFGEHVEAFQNGLGPWMKSPFAFKRYGRCGKLMSDIVAPLGKVVDDMAFVHNMIGKTGVHSQATYLQATGFQLPGFPGAGSWVSYGLGLRERGPADLRGAAGSSRLRFQRPEELGIRVSAHSHPRDYHLSAAREPHRGSSPPCRIRDRGQSPGRHRFDQSIEPTSQKKPSRGLTT